MTAALSAPTSAAPNLRSGSGAQEGEQLQLVTFRIGDEEFGVDILAVQEINRMMQITIVPQCPPCVEGVINLRGRIIPVLDLRKRFGMATIERGRDSRIVVVEVSGRTVGFIVDQVDRVLRLDSAIVEPAPTMVATVDSDYIRGVGKLDDRLIILLDLDRLLDDHMLSAVQTTAANVEKGGR